MDLNQLSRRGGSLPVSIQLCITLRYLATGSFQYRVGELCGVTRSTGKFKVQFLFLIPLDPDLETAWRRDKSKRQLLSKRIISVLDGDEDQD